MISIRNLTLALAVIAAFALAACDGGTETKQDSPEAGGDSQPSATAPEETAPDKPHEIPVVTEPKPADHPLLHPAKHVEEAPPVYRARFETTAGDFVVEVRRDWAPVGADRFYNLVKSGFFDDACFFRCIKGFMVQFGINPDPVVNEAWINARIPDDAVKQSNGRSYLSFATSGPNSRTTQVFINYVTNDRLDGMGFAPFGKIVEGLRSVDKINGEYGEGAPRGRGPGQGQIQERGNAYLQESFPRLDYIKRATIVE